MTKSRSPWVKVWLMYFAGLLAAAQLGKMSALAPLVAGARDLRLTTVAIAISLIEIGGATLGAVAGVFAVVLWRADLPEHADAPTAAPAAGLTPALWCFALAFGAFALFQVGIPGLLPTLLVREVGLGAQAAGQSPGQMVRANGLLESAHPLVADTPCAKSLS